MTVPHKPRPTSMTYNFSVLVLVLGGGLDKLAWALVGIKPFINLGHIVIQVLAGAKGSFEIRHDGTDLFDSSNIFARFDVIKGSLGLSDDT